MAERNSQTARFPFTVRRLRTLPAPTQGRVYHYDKSTSGLCLCVTASGTKTFYIYRRISGKPTRVRLGRFPDVSLEAARQAAVELAGEVAKGRDPAAERRAKREAPTLGELFDYWLTTHAKLHKKTWRDDIRIFDKYLAKWRSRRLSTITKARVRAWHAAVGGDRGRYQANRALALLSAVWGKADDLGHSGSNPCRGVRRFKEQSRERFLQPAEMRAFFAALMEEEPVWRDFFLIALFTGARRSNVAAMAWADVDLTAGVWYLAGGETKGGEPLAIVLPPPAIEILRSRIESRADSPWVFPGRTATGHVAHPRVPWGRVLKRSGIRDLRIHDLRRSLGSWQAAAGASLPVIGRSLGHRNQQTTQVYARLQLDPVRESVNRATAAMLAAGGLLEEDGDG